LPSARTGSTLGTPYSVAGESHVAFQTEDR
jgi:hypothetical protein